MTRYIKENSGIDVTCQEVQDLIDQYYDTSKAFEQDTEIPSLQAGSRTSSPRIPNFHQNMTILQHSHSPSQMGRGYSASPKKTMNSKRKAPDNPTTLDDALSHTKPLKKSNRIQQSPSPAPIDKNSFSFIEKEEHHGSKIVEFSLPLDEFEELMEKARKSGVESVGSTEADDHHLLHPKVPASKKSGRKKSPAVKTSESNSSPSQRRSRK